MNAEMEAMHLQLKEAGASAAQASRVSNDLASALQASAGIMMRWDKVKARELPEELAEALEEQRRACSQVLKGKADVLAFLQEEGVRKEQQFTVLLDSQRQALDTLMRRMRAAYLEVRESCSVQVREAERAFQEEREELMAAQKREVDSLLEARRSLEERYVEDHLAREDQHSQELYATQVSDMENYQRLKVKLERDVMMLEQQLEAIKFTYLLNKGEWGGGGRRGKGVGGGARPLFFLFVFSCCCLLFIPRDAHQPHFPSPSSPPCLVPPLACL